MEEYSGAALTHVSRCEGTLVPQTGRQSGTIRRRQVQDHGRGSVLHQALHGGPTQTRCPTSHQANHTLFNQQVREQVKAGGLYLETSMCFSERLFCFIIIIITDIITVI